MDEIEQGIKAAVATKTNGRVTPLTSPTPDRIRTAGKGAADVQRASAKETADHILGVGKAMLKAAQDTAKETVERATERMAEYEKIAAEIISDGEERALMIEGHTNLEADVTATMTATILKIQPQLAQAAE